MQKLMEDDRGGITLEYAVLYTAFGLGLALALAVVSPYLVEFFQVRVAWLALPVP